MNTWTGTKYSGYRDVVDIAKDLRQDIKSARSGGTLALPTHAKVSVSCGYSTSSQSIHVLIMDLTPDELWTDPRPNPDYRDGRLAGKPSALRSAAEAKLRELTSAYNQDKSDTQADHFDVLFYSNVSSDCGPFYAKQG